jgi:hypothetical protein
MTYSTNAGSSWTISSGGDATATIIGIEFLSNPTITINSPLNNSYFNYTNNILLNVSLDKNSNLSYNLNNGLNLTLCTNCNTSTIFINGTIGQNNLSIYSNYSGIITNSNIVFTIDTTTPVITNKMPTSQLYNYTLLKLTNYISCSDSNIVWCNISSDGFNKNATATNNITYTTNGNKTYTLIAQDRAGNRVTTSGAFRVNPYQYFRF